MQANELKEYLIEDVERVIKVLEFYKLHSIIERNGEIRCASPNGDNPTAVMIKLDNLFSTYFADANPFRGDILGLLQHFSKDSFKTVVINIHALLGLSYGGKSEVKTSNTFNPLEDLEKYLKKVERREDKGKNKLHDKSFLDRFYIKPHPEIYREAILPKVAEKFDIRYDTDRNRIIFPHFDWLDTDKVVGVQGRIIGLTTSQANELGVSKYWNYIKGYKKSQNLYGWHVTKDNILETKQLIIFEGEKSVLKHYSFTNGKGCSVALGGHEISSDQVDFIIKNTPIDCEIILAFDNDVLVDEEYMKECCKKFSEYRTVSYLSTKNKNGNYKNLLKEKDSPIDRGYKVFKFILAECKNYVK